MKAYRILFLLMMFAISCNSTGRNEPAEKRTDEKTRRKAIEIGEYYIQSQVNEPTKIVTRDGIIIIGDNFQKYVINPGKIYTGDLNEDGKTDAILTLDRFQGQFQVPSEQLFLINRKGKLVLDRTIVADMRVIKLENSIITAEVPIHSRNSPLFSCHECQDTIAYRFRNGELVRIE